MACRAFSPLFLILTIKEIYAQNKALRKDASGFSVSKKDSPFAAHKNSALLSALHRRSPSNKLFLEEQLLQNYGSFKDHTVLKKYNHFTCAPALTGLKTAGSLPLKRSGLCSELVWG